jgi:hypothetical protein
MSTPTLAYVTAQAILVVLEDGAKHIAKEFRQEVALAGGDAGTIQAASKWLRDRGVPIHTTKQGWMSTWSIAATPTQMAVYYRRILTEHYSQCVSHARASSMIMGIGSKSGYEMAVRSCIDIGARLDIPLETVIAQCKPLPSELATKWRGGQPIKAAVISAPVVTRTSEASLAPKYNKAVADQN